MADGTDRDARARWRALAEGELRARTPDDLVWRTLEGIDVHALYTEADLAGLDHLGTVPGEAPFVRGVRATMYAGRPWDDPPICRLLDGRGKQRLLPPRARGRASRGSAWPSTSRPTEATTAITPACRATWARPAWRSTPWRT